MRRVRNGSVLENASKLLLPYLLAPNEVKAQVFSQPAERAPLSVGFGNCQTRFDRNRWMDCGGRSGFATSTQQECTMYSYERQFVKLCLQKNR